MSVVISEAMLEAMPVCRIHKVRMDPVSWEIDSSGTTTGTDYACGECCKERKKDEPVAFHSGPVIEFYRPGVIGANGERVPF